MKTSILAGQLVVGGFHGTALTKTFREALARGERGGAILFSRNIEGVMSCRALNAEIAAAAPAELPPLVMVDQEGGRVARL
jgi:beta-N-acetylhexosaminidase